jgi:CheY-like chemotaxis protein
MNAITPSALPCPNCKTPIDIINARWCHCLSKELTILCSSCGHCFCKLLDYPRLKDWKLALAQLGERKIEEEFRRAVQTSCAADAGSSPLILIVDDDEEIRLIAEYTLREMGYQTLTASGAEEALQLVERYQPAIVLTDALMPKVDGRQLCHLIKGLNASIKVVIMSAVYTKSPYRREAMKDFQADEYLAKPIDFTRLHEVLEHLGETAA